MPRKIDKDAIAWVEDRPARESLPFILSPKAGQRRQAILLGGEGVGVFLHFWEGRTTPCTEPILPCPACADPRTRRDHKRFCAAVTPRGLYPCIPDLTPHALLTCPELHHPERLRGKLLTLERKEGKYNGPVWASLSDVRLDQDVLQEPFDLCAALVAIWESEGKGR